MNSATFRASQSMPRGTQTRMQGLLDEGDALFFASNPHARERRRFYFRGERIDDHGAPSRYIIVSVEGGTLVRRFDPEAGAA